MLQIKLVLVGIIYSQSNKCLLGVKIKMTDYSDLVNDSPSNHMFVTC